jgi:carboxymethylenebutenolidase
VDERVVSFTHDVEVDFLLPGAPPTGRHVAAPTIAIGGFRDGLLAYEHINWDQGSVLVQTGLLEATGLPVAGAETAQKLLDDAGPFNELIKSPDPGGPTDTLS